MKNRQFLPLILSALFFISFSCQNESPENENKSKKSSEHQSTDSELHLNNGSKWMANLDTEIGIQNMQRIIESFSDGASEKDYAALKDALQLEFKMIFDKCTMEGAAHDQLHNYLYPFMGLFKALEKENSEQALTNISAHLEVYFKYFETK